MKATLLLVLGIAACAAPGPDLDTLMARSHTYRERPIADLLGILGAPNSQQRIGPAVWYAWDYDRFYDVQHWHCRLTAAVRDDGIIVHTTVDGNRAGCRELLTRLK